MRLFEVSPAGVVGSMRLSAIMMVAIINGQASAAQAAAFDSVIAASQSKSMPMGSTFAAKTEFAQHDLHLRVSFDYVPESGSLEVRYELRNDRDSAIAVFDRGDRHGVLTRQQKLGDVPSPAWEMDGKNAMTLSHIALPLPQPAPTVPAVPLAIQVLPGGDLQGHFSFSLPLNNDASRLRWCLGVADFKPSDFSSPESSAAGQIWRASFAVVDRQTQLCTPWFDLNHGKFDLK